MLWERVQKVKDITYKNNIGSLPVEKRYQGTGWCWIAIPQAGEIQLHADYLVGAIGREACLDCLSDAFLQQAQELQERGILYMIGDVKNGIYRQTAIAVGEGVMTAMKICRQLKETSE